MTVGHELGEIQRTMEDVLDPKDKREQEQSRRSRLNGYEQTLRRVEQIAGRSTMETLAAYIKAEIKQRESPLTEEEVREKACWILREHDYDIKDDSWFDS